MRLSTLLVLPLASLLAAEPAVDSRELPRFPAVEPADAPKTFQVKPGFHAELVAAEPNVASPVAVSFDENGRMFVCEMRDYSEDRDAKPHLGRIRRLEDRDGDGKFEHATIFADDLAWPTGVFCANGGIFVAAAPDIWFFKDADGDGRAEVREVVFTGFTTGNARLNVQALPNCFSWGPDNRLHLQSASGNRGMIRCPKRPELPPQELGGRDFWFDPRTLDFGFEAGGAQYGMSFDDEGRRFACSNSDHLRLFLFDTRYAARNSFCPLPSPLVSVAADGPAAEVFRISPDEPWRVIRTRWRVSGRVPGAVEGGGRVSGYFTGATGTTVYRGDAYGADFVGNTFTGDAGGNLVHRKTLRRDGVSVLGERPADEKKAEFFASRDTWFRPVNFANAPDGTLYVIDMYREVIEHPWSIPEPIKKHLDLTSGRDRGRIWRLAPDGFKPRPAPQLGAADTAALVATLAHPNGWHRDTATRLLLERQDPAAPALLERAITAEPAALGRLHALRARAGFGTLPEQVLVQALEDRDAAVRELGVRLAEENARPGETLWARLAPLAADPAPRVRLQLAFTLGALQHAGVVATLTELARRDAGDRWIAAAVRSGPPERMAPLAQTLLADAAFAQSAAGTQFLAPLVAGIAARNEPAEVAALFARTAANPPSFPLLLALGEGLSRKGTSLARLDRERRLEAIFATARTQLGDANAPAAQRADAARLLGFDPAPATRETLLGTVGAEIPDAVLRATFEALDRTAANETAGALLARWPALETAARTETLRFLLARPARTALLLDALEAGTLKPAELPQAEAAQLRASKDAKLAERAARLLPAPAHESRETVLARLRPALQLTGEAAPGRATYQQRCATCHRFRGEGIAFGPDLESVVSGGKEKLLTHVIDPNREVAPQFAAYTAELKNGTTLAGVLASETPEAVTIREPLGRETTVARAELVRLQTTGSSPMPEGLEAGLTPQDFADLLRFLAGQ